MNRFSGKTCVVTGGGSGIGKALTELLREHGATVHAFDINANGLDNLEAGVGQLHRATQFFLKHLHRNIEHEIN